MSISTTTHLNFNGNAREALEFYRSVFGGTLSATTYGELGAPADSPDAAKVVFGSVQSDDGFRVMAYDVPGGGGPSGAGQTSRAHGMTFTDSPFFVSVRGASLDEITSSWQKLAARATVVEPLAASAWSAGFGMVSDEFGVTWVFDVA